MNFLEDKLSAYIESYSSPETDLLKKINRETHSQVLMPQMLAGHLQGRVLAMLSKMIKPKNILEIGTFTGYSAICLAEGLTESGKLITIDINPELQKRVNRYFIEAGMENTIRYIIGNALEIIPDLTEDFQLVFIDADKISYAEYYDLVIEKIDSGGFIIADNVLWDGKVIQDQKKIDDDTMAIKEFNKKVNSDDRVENVILPVRDGLMVSRKR